jgi:restriction system protein
MRCLAIGFSIRRRKKGYKHRNNIKKGKRVLSKINNFDHPGAKVNYLKKIDPFVFEELLMSALERKGFKIKRNKKYTGDGGIDGMIWDNTNRKYLIQAKRYASHVNKQHILDFEKLVIESNCFSGLFIHTGKTGRNTYKGFKQGNIKIISGSNLIDLLTINN